MDWLVDNWANIYVGGALIVGALVAIAVFFGIWWFAANRYQLGGLVLGWVPGGVAAITADPVLGLAWPLLLIGAVIYFNR